MKDVTLASATYTCGRNHDDVRPIDLDFLPLTVTHVSLKGKRPFDPDGKRRLVEARLRPGASHAGLALKAGANANQLRKWVDMYRKASAVAGSPRTIAPESAAFASSWLSRLSDAGKRVPKRLFTQPRPQPDIEQQSRQPSRCRARRFQMPGKLT